MIVTIDTDYGKLTIDGKCYDIKPEKTISTMAEEIAKHRGDTEYNGIVADIQRWYYGSLVKSPWCATSISYFANLCGILDQIGGKNENVYYMMKAAEKAHPEQFFDAMHIPATIKRNDILFFNWDMGIMNSGSNKHVTVAEYDSVTNNIFCIGGNQKDKICTLAYDKKYLYAVFRPVYGG